MFSFSLCTYYLKAVSSKLNLHLSGLGLSHVSLGHELELLDSSVNDVILNDAFVCILYLI